MRSPFSLRPVLMGGLASLLCAAMASAQTAQTSPPAQAAQMVEAVQPGQGARTAAPDRLTFDAALASALSRHPDVRAAVAERDAAQAQLRQAGAWANPEVAALVEDNRRETRTTTWQWNQPIEWGGKRGARMQAAEWAARQAEVDVAAARSQVRARVTQAFYGAAVAQERLRLAGELAQWADRGRDAAARRVGAGKAPPIEEIKAQVAAVQARAAAGVAQGEWRAAWQLLVQAIGGQPEGVQGVPAAQAMPSVDADLLALPDAAPWQDLDSRMKDAGVLRRAELEVARRRALAEVERSRSTPDLVVNLGVKRDEQVGRNQPLLGVSVSLPLFDRNEGAHTAAIRQADKAEAELEALRAGLRAQAVEASEQLNAAVTQARTLRETVLPAARQALDLSSRGYELGKFGFLDVLDAQRTYFEVQGQLLASTDQAFRAQARLIALLGHEAIPLEGTKESEE